MCDVGYLCANFNLPIRPLYSGLRPDVRDLIRSAPHFVVFPSAKPVSLWPERKTFLLPGVGLPLCCSVLEVFCIT